MRKLSHNEVEINFQVHYPKIQLSQWPLASNSPQTSSRCMLMALLCYGCPRFTLGLLLPILPCAMRRPPRSHTDTQVWVPAAVPCTVTATSGCRLLGTPTGRMFCLGSAEVMVLVEQCRCQSGFDYCCLHSKVSFLPVTNFHAFFFFTGWLLCFNSFVSEVSL